MYRRFTRLSCAIPTPCFVSTGKRSPPTQARRPGRPDRPRRLAVPAKAWTMHTTEQDRGGVGEKERRGAGEQEGRRAGQQKSWGAGEQGSMGVKERGGEERGGGERRGG